MVDTSTIVPCGTTGVALQVRELYSCNRALPSSSTQGNELKLNAKYTIPAAAAKYGSRSSTCPGRGNIKIAKRSRPTQCLPCLAQPRGNGHFRLWKTANGQDRHHSPISSRRVCVLKENDKKKNEKQKMLLFLFQRNKKPHDGHDGKPFDTSSTCGHRAWHTPSVSITRLCSCDLALLGVSQRIRDEMPLPCCTRRCSLPEVYYATSIISYGFAVRSTQSCRSTTSPLEKTRNFRAKNKQAPNFLTLKRA